MVYSEASKRATAKYKKTHYKRMAVEMTTEEHEALKAAADRVSESVNGYVRTAIRQRIARETDSGAEGSGVDE